MCTKMFWTSTRELSFFSSRTVGHSISVLCFVYADWNLVTYKAWRLAFKLTVHTFSDLFGDVVKKLERSKELLLHSANIAHYQEAQESRLLFAREFEAQQEQKRQDRLLAVMNWLSPPTSCGVEHEELQRRRSDFPDTTRWIFTQKSMRHWLQPDGRSNPMFWICGILGAGTS